MLDFVVPSPQGTSWGEWLFCPYVVVVCFFSVVLVVCGLVILMQSSATTSSVTSLFPGF